MTLPVLLEAGQEILSFLQAAGLRACLIGGLAAQRWGEPRATQDVDLSVQAPFGQEDRVIVRSIESRPLSSIRSLGPAPAPPGRPA